ncbi:MAG TPA: hypothetical protein VKQ71_05315, partial [Acidimicrobiales bacterium]|nr:hypothetical protein [Acidimicrobiales bacterium]
MSVAPVFELFGDHKSVFAQVATGPDQILGALRITPTGRMWVVTDAADGSIYDITAGGDFTHPTPFVSGLFPGLVSNGYIDGFVIDAAGNAYVAHSEDGPQPLAIVSPAGKVTYTTTLYDNATGLLVANGNTCTPGNTLYIYEGGTGRVLAHDLTTGADTVWASGFVPGGSHVAGQMVQNAQSQIFLLAETNANVGLFDITAGGSFFQQPPLVYAPFRFDVNECGVNSAGSIFCAGNDSKACYVSTRQSGVQQPFVVYEADLGDTESIAVGPPGAQPSPNSPVVSITVPPQVNPGVPAPFVGAVSEPGLPAGSTLSYRWSAASGPGSVTFASPTALTSTATFSAPGVYLVQLGATDGENTGLAQAEVAVGPNQAPTVNAGADITVTMPANGIALHGTVHDDGLPLGAILTTTWSTQSGPAQASFTDAGSLTTTVSFPAPGTYVLQLAASDTQYTTTSTLTATVVPANQPPVIANLQAPATVPFAGSAHLSAIVTDDGLPVGSSVSVEWSQVTGPGSITFTSPNQTSTDASFGNAVGTFVLQLSATDGQLTTVQQFSINVLPRGAIDQPPLVSAGPNLTLSAPSCGVVLAGSATDDGLPAGSTLVVKWIQMGGPVPVTFANAASATTTACFNAPGQYLLWLEADDSAAYSIASVQVYVLEPTSASPLTVSASGPSSVDLPPGTATYAGAIQDDGSIPASAINISWSQVSGPLGVTFTGPPAGGDTLSTGVQFHAPGSYVLEFTATDGTHTASANVPVTVSRAVQGPIVNAGPAQFLTVPTLTTTLTGSATDPGLPPGGSLTYMWTAVGPPVAVSIATPTQASTAVSFSYPGTYTFQLTVSDGQQVGSATTTVTVSPGQNTVQGPPTVSIGGLSDGQVVTKPAQVLGTVSDGAWVLEQRLGGRDDVQTPWTVVASGTGAITSQAIETFDPTLLLNGIYSLRLSATTIAGSASAGVSVAVDGRMKVGNFTLAFTDLESVVSNLPFRITRT